MSASSESGRRARFGLNSIRARLLVAASLTLAASFILTGFALERAFRESATQAVRDRLEGMVHSLLAAAAYNYRGQLTISDSNIGDARLRQPSSGIEAALFDAQSQTVWSTSSLRDVPTPDPLGVGEWRFRQNRAPDAFALAFGVEFIDLQSAPQRYVLVVMEDATGFHTQINAYRRSLFTWLLGSGVMLLAAQLLTLRWGIAPLKRLVRELRRIEAGDQAELKGNYPEELEALTDGLNAMIRNERNQQTRYRRALNDLAHSLKTPLAVVRGYADDPGLAAAPRRALAEQVALMQQITGYQISKAAAAGRRTLSEPVPIRPIVEKLASALGKVYGDKSLQFDVRVSEPLRLRADAGDLFELLGGLMDNAAKYGGGHIRISAQRHRSQSTICVEDNGPGFPEHTDDLLNRGIGADSQTPGQGVGLAAVRELVRAYEGQLELSRSELGGAQVTVQLPA